MSCPRSRVVAPAKLTVSLTVTGTRSDGYHLLDAEMLSIDLCDELLIDPMGSELRIRPTEHARAHQLTGGDGNLIVRALTLAGRSAVVELTKRIPVGGGLGGGSSDAGAVLRWAGFHHTEAAAKLGADVPFCMVGGAARVSGIGEVVEPIHFEPRSFVLLIPPFGVETGAVYREWDRLSAALGRPWHEPPNDLTSAALGAEPRLAAWRRLFARVTGREPILAGSGSTWFVEGRPEDLGIGHMRTLSYQGETGLLIAAAAVPEGWPGQERAGHGDGPNVVGEQPPPD